MLILFMTITFDRYDEICNEVSKIPNSSKWYPTVEEIKKHIAPNPEKYILFLIWFLETTEKPTTPEGKEAIKLAGKILNHNLELID